MKAQTKIGLDFENRAQAEGFRFIAGVDEVGRGCLAGPVVAAAVILDLSKPLPAGINDSKKLTAKKREELNQLIRENAFAISIAQIEADEIDRINILQATKKAMRAAIEGLDPRADFLLIDAVRLENNSLPQKSIIKGDSISVSIAAASIVAKVFRDRLMSEAEKTFPHYCFSQNFGYGTQAHLDALKTHGECSLHRRTFAGVLQNELPFG